MGGWKRECLNPPLRHVEERRTEISASFTDTRDEFAMDPYVSFVITGRNDGHEGDFLHRMQHCVDSILKLSERVGLAAELVAVDWNPPVDRPSLKEAVDLIDDRENTSVVFVEVPPEVHDSLDNPGEMEFFQFLAKNVGIRNATGEYIVSTNADLIFSEELLRFFVETDLESELCYRLNRYDLGQRVPSDLSIDPVLDFCRENVVKVATRDGNVEDKAAKERLKQGAREIYQVAVKDRHYQSTTDQIKATGDILKRVISPKSVAEIHDTVPPEQITTSSPEAITEFFNCACGDFLMMASEDWERMRGYPEFAKEVHIDTIGLAALIHLGFDQAIINNPMRVYHQPHPRERTRSRPYIQDAIDTTNELLATRGDEIPSEYRNGENWGLYDRDLVIEQPES
jgi:hypothetical protein